MSPCSSGGGGEAPAMKIPESRPPSPLSGPGTRGAEPAKPSPERCVAGTGARPAGRRPAAGGAPAVRGLFRCGSAGPTGARAPRLRGGARRAVRARPGAVGGSVFSRRCRQKEPGGTGACSLLLRSALRAVARRACVSIPCCCVFQVDK